ncbi:hypothetical protein [Methylobacterium sp.]|uniref:hypothetical protein n=1 Tax=Methylobacterium sp. TaxID=409 RepID=UPI003B0011C2
MSAEQDHSGHAREPATDPGSSASGSQTAAANGEGDAGSFAAIEAEGAREHWLLARRTAQAVFTDPAAVTPRRMALLGEQGLARFVEEVRAAARLLIKREREKGAEAQNCDATVPDQSAAATIEPDPSPTAVTIRRPYAFRMAKTSPRRPIGTAWMARLRPSASVRSFAVDVMTWTALLAVTLIGMLAAYRLLLLPLV